ncbi:MAG: hypothetical protein EP315_02025 [Gammaproteobacteria bacterium]|nr:MAG: hypothetical protein EP315_02025 [Gammaproteobacteria bacterium]
MRIVLGTTNTLYSSEDELQYSAPFVVQVTRENEQPAAGALVEITAKPTFYFKGGWAEVDTNGDTITDAWSLAYSVVCPAEDANNNGSIDAGEDINNNGRLEPTHPGTIAPHPVSTPTVSPGTGRIFTNNEGFGYFVITYPKSEALWTRIEITAKTDVTGTEESDVISYTLGLTDEDVVYPLAPSSGVTSRYGTSINCTDDL